MFDNLFAGDYKIRFTLPTGFVITTKETGIDGLVDSNPDATGTTPVFTLKVVEQDPDNPDAEYHVRPTVPADGTTVALLIDPSIDAGIWQPLAVGDYVWYDLDRDGIQEPGEKPVVGVKVELLTAAGSPATDADGIAVPAAITDVAGHYVFDYLVAGDYRVRFTELPAGYLTTVQGAGADRLVDSNPDGTGLSPVFDLTATSPQVRPVASGDGTTRATLIDPSIDAGIWVPLAVGDFVWYDTNHNGVQDASEAPVAGVTVILVNDDGTPALHANGQPVAVTVTDASGHYVFDNLVAGSYRVRFTGLPVGFEPTTQLVVGGTSGTDSNPDGTGTTPVFDLGPDAGDVRRVVVGDGATVAVLINPTIDAGVYQYRVDLSIVKTVVGEIVAGQNTTWKLVVSNAGPDAESGLITVTDNPPSDLTYVESAGTGWACTVSGQKVTCVTDRDLEPNSSLPELLIRTRVAAGVTGEVANGATVTSPRLDITEPNNASLAKSPVVKPGKLPGTGATIWRTLLVGLVLLVLGVGVTSRSRRRRMVA